MKSFSAYRGATAAALPSLRVPGLSVQALCLLALALPAQATQTVVTIDAGVRTSNTEGQCLFPTPGFTGHDCSYNASNPAGAVLATKWVGPVYSAAFFGPGAAPQATPDNFINPTGPGDGRIGIPLSGTITIDDQGNPAACSTHTIAGVIQMGGFSRNYGTQPLIRFIDDFPNGITQTIAAQAVSSGTANGAGGCDYVLGSAGVPNALASIGSAPFPNDPFPGQVSHTNTPSPPPRGSGTTEWTVPVAGTPGLARFEGTVAAPANVGLAAVSTIGPGYTCLKLNAATQMLPPIPCGAGSTTSLNSSTQADWDNIVGRISTNSSGNITSSLLFLVQEIIVVGRDSWLGYTAAITATAPGAAAAAVDDTASTRQDTPTSISVLANDTNFVNPVTVSISVLSANGGTAAVVGSPGSQAAISVTYTPPVGFVGTDSFQYTATDGSGGNDTALVTVTVTANAQPVAGEGAITSITTAGFDPSARTGAINVANSPAGNSLGDAPAIVTATGATKGTVSVTGSTVTYTPLASFFQGTDEFNYTITDNELETDTNKVIVTIPDATPTVADGTDTGDQDTVLNATGTFTPGNGSPAQHTTVITQASNGSCVASVTASSVAVAYTPDAAFSGSDSCSVQVTDGDGDSDSATFNFTVAATSAPLVIPGGPGSGSLDLWSLTLLGALPLLRRRRRV